MSCGDGPVIYRGAAALEAAVGEELGPTGWLVVDQSRINGFAEDTIDHQWIHVDAELAADGPFGATIAHGFLTLSLVPYFVNRLRRIEGMRMGVNYGLDRVRFPAPVRAGSRIRASSRMISFQQLEDAVQIVTRTTIEIEHGGKPACVADLVARYYPEDNV
ncbi:MaoC family dehydratase [Tomitella biformata]|uniref:MaoC family dehydratase n=1 Tax=Tomitella biformata TaxID=630403 RepID=UPI0004666BAF|nr:MaoC family dehydratase [Tomitella biformata]